MDRRDFIRNLGAAVVLAATSSYGRLASTVKLEPVAEPSFAYFGSAPRFQYWAPQEGGRTMPVRVHTEQGGPERQPCKGKWRWLKTVEVAKQ